MLRAIKRLCIVWIGVAYLLFLPACAQLEVDPPDEAIKLAIAQQLTDIQQCLSQDLGIPIHQEASGENQIRFDIKSVNVDERRQIEDKNFLRSHHIEEAYRVIGTYRAASDLLSDAITATPATFDLSLGRGLTGRQLSAELSEQTETEVWFLISD